MSHDEGKMVRVSEPEGKMVRVSEPPGDGGAPLDSVWILSGPGSIWIWMDSSGFGWIHLDLNGFTWIWVLCGSCLGGP